MAPASSLTNLNMTCARFPWSCPTAPDSRGRQCNAAVHAQGQSEGVPATDASLDGGVVVFPSRHGYGGECLHPHHVGTIEICNFAVFNVAMISFFGRIYFAIGDALGQRARFAASLLNLGATNTVPGR